MSTEFPLFANILFFAITGFLLVITLIGLNRILVAKAGALSSESSPQVNRSLLGWVGGIILIWLTVLSVMSLNGFFADFMAIPPRVMLTVLVCFLTILILAANKRFAKSLLNLPPTWLIVPQVFRVAVEIVLWLLYENGNTPQQMTFEGLNFDILAGLSAPVVAYFAFSGGRKNYTLALVWNILSMGLLINILTVAVLSMPLVGAFDDPNTFVSFFPYILLPGFVAPFAMMLHVFSIKQLLKLRKAGN